MTCRLRSLFVLTFALGSVALGQTTAADAAPSPADSKVSCNPWKPQLYPATLSFGELACMQYSQLASPGLAAESVFMAGYGQWRTRKTDFDRNDNMADRIEHLYERRAARVTAETIVGYLHHEDPRLHPSGKEGVWRRTGAALLSVIDSPDQNGKDRIAFAPLAGSLGSGFTAMAIGPHQTSVGYGLERSGIIYSHYFIRALYHEFSPDLWSIAPRFIRKHHTPDAPAN